eukprot:353631-Chlamydomonas_euryale.AAC.4
MKTKNDCSPPRPASTSHRVGPRDERPPARLALRVVGPRGHQPQISERGPGTVPPLRPPPRLVTRRGLSEEQVLHPGHAAAPSGRRAATTQCARRAARWWGAGPKGDALHAPQEAVVRPPKRAPLLIRQSPHLRRHVGQRRQHIRVVQQALGSGVLPDLAQRRLKPPEAGRRRREAAAVGGLRRTVVLHHVADILEQRHDLHTLPARHHPELLWGCGRRGGGREVHALGFVVTLFQAPLRSHRIQDASSPP